MSVYAIPKIGPARRRWEGDNNDGDSWVVEIEADRFTTSSPEVVSLYVENGAPESTTGREAGLADLTPGVARDLAAVLLRCADSVEQANATGRKR